MSSSQGSRFSEYTSTNHQAPLWIATSLTLTYAVLFLIVRLVVKFKVLGLDDLFLGVAHVLGIAQWGVMYAALDDGVGKLVAGIDHSDNISQTTSVKLVFVSRILTLLTVGFTKCSIILFLRQIFAGTANKSRTICTALLIITSLWTVASALTVSISCPPSGALLLESGAHCTGDLTRWRAMTGLDVCFEVILVLIPTCLFYSVQISRTRKLTIFGAFLPRIAVAAIFIAYVEAYINFRKYGGTSIDAVSTLVWQQVLCGYSLVSATTPCLKGFLGRFRTEDLARVTEGSSGTRTYGQNSATRTYPETYVLKPLDHKSSGNRPPIDEPTALACHPADVLHSATAYAEGSGDNGNGSVKSFGSERMMIHHKVEYRVTSS